MPAVQKVSDKKPDRNWHVWYRRVEGDWKCVICGGISFEPSNTCDCIRHEQLTNTERNMCPPQDIPIEAARQTEERGRRKK